MGGRQTGTTDLRHTRGGGAERKRKGRDNNKESSSQYTESQPDDYHH